MKFVTISPENIDSPAQQIADYIKVSNAKSRRVLWLVSGGSAIKVAVRARQLIGELGRSDLLQVALSDERYGEVGHENSNFKQLIDSGFDASGLTFYSVLTGADIAVTSKHYGDTLKALLQDADVAIGLLGMGSDGHTAGLLPENPLMDSPDSVGFFEGSDHARITVTPEFFRHMNEVVLYAVGEAKWPILTQLETTELPVSCLKQADELTVYSDYREIQT